VAGDEEVDVRSGVAQAPGVELVLDHLRLIRAFDFTGYKRATLDRRIRRRMQHLGIDTHEKYVEYLEVHPDEFEPLFDTMLINVTSFFRDPEVWDVLRVEVVPRLVERSRAVGRTIRVWSAGCATGEEAYSAVMLFAELLGTAGISDRVKVYATDVDDGALELARQAVYTDQALEHVPDDAKRYFTKAPRGHAVDPEVRRAVIFGHHDLLQDAPISRVDLLLCRNTLMYFNADVQARLLSRLHYSLADDGILVLGRVETRLSDGGLFQPINARHRVFSKVTHPSVRSRLLAIGTADRAAGSVGQADEHIVELGFESASTGQVLLDGAGLVLAANARARAMFGLSEPATGRPFQDLELSYRPVELRSSIDEARATGRTVSLRDVVWPSTGDRSSYLDIDVVPLRSHDEHVGVLLTFVDVTMHHRMRDELAKAHVDLDQAYQEVQSTNEELETTNEELQSTVEELETTNEELQSTNEELETMNEELSASNEELHAVNEEARERNAELDRVNAYVESIVARLDASLVVVDQSLTVRLWNGRSPDMWGLSADEAVGQRFGDLDVGFDTELVEPAMRRCISDDASVSLTVPVRRGSVTQDGLVMLSPLRSAAGTVDGVVVLMTVHDPSRIG
jgi:two-component system CheB/CheR fusion protein